MNLYKSEQWMKDVDEIIEHFTGLSKLANKTILITGATGLICSSVVDILLRNNERNSGKKITVLVAGRSKQRFQERFCQYVNSPFLNFIPYDALSDTLKSCCCDYIIHGASITSPQKYLSEAVETMANNFISMYHLLELARKKSVIRTLYISSSEVYGKKENEQPFVETEYGYVDLLNPRSSYAVSKRATETLCISYSFEYGLDNVIVRPGHIYGPTASPSDVRVSSAWAYDAAQGKNIIMKSDGLQLRSYCYCLDCASAILKVLIYGKNAHAYNISNPDSIISIKEMGELLAKVAKVKLIQKEATVQESNSYNPMSNSSLDSTELLAIGWKGLFDAKRGFSHTVEILKDMMN